MEKHCFESILCWGFWGIRDTLGGFKVVEATHDKIVELIINLKILKVMNKTSKNHPKNLQCFQNTSNASRRIIFNASTKTIMDVVNFALAHLEVEIN